MRRLLRAATLATATLLPGCFLGDNFHEVNNGLYRSGAMNQSNFEDILRKHDIRSVLNLQTSGSDSHMVEEAICKRYGIAYKSFPMSSRRALEAERRDELIDFLENTPRSLLIHCQAGIDRTGYVAGVAILLLTGSIDEAGEQLSFHYGYIIPSGIGESFEKDASYYISKRNNTLTAK